MQKKDQQAIAKQLKYDLDEIHKDWMHLFEVENDLNNSIFLSKVASDILTLDKDALEALHTENLKEKGEMLHFLLTTPWGAPFIGETTLLEAAQSYSEKNSDSSLHHLLNGFISHGSEKHTALFNVFEDIARDIPLSE